MSRSIWASITPYQAGIDGLSHAAEPTREQASRDRLARSIERLDQLHGEKERRRNARARSAPRRI